MLISDPGNTFLLWRSGLGLALLGDGGLNGFRFSCEKVLYVLDLFRLEGR